MSVFGDFMIQGVVKAEAEANELRVQLDAWHTSFGTTQLTHALAERDTLITALRECVSALGRCRNNMAIWDGKRIGLDDLICKVESTLERYKHEHP